MHQAIPSNLGEILLKRLIIFIVLFVLVMGIIYLSQSVFVHQVPSAINDDSFTEINKIRDTS
jgi:hypothetical protein